MHSHSAFTSHTHAHTPKRSWSQQLLYHMHDTELWASHLPRVPHQLIVLAVLGLGLIIYSIAKLQSGFQLLYTASLLVGFLLSLPALLAAGFAWRKWRYISVIRQEIFSSLNLRGDEQVLDVGCGSGLLLNAAAQRLTSGKATGIDIWASHNGGGNLDLLLRNARAEGVADKIEFKEADARQMPFAEGTFDVVLSSGALHHISHNFEDHDRAVREMARVLKPGGKIVLWDITHMIEATAAKLDTLGVTCEVRPTVRSMRFDMSLLTGRKGN